MGASLDRRASSGNTQACLPWPAGLGALREDTDSERCRSAVSITGNWLPTKPRAVSRETCRELMLLFEIGPAWLAGAILCPAAALGRRGPGMGRPELRPPDRHGVRGLPHRFPRAHALRARIQGQRLCAG